MIFETYKAKLFSLSNLKTCLFVMLIFFSNKNIHAQTMLKGFLDYLNVPATSFSAVQNKLVFKFYIQNQQKLTLHGWEVQANGTDIDDDDPAIKLVNGNPSSVAFDAGTYFGDLVLGRQEVKRLKKKIANNPALTYVVFEPNTVNGHIEYKIYLNNVAALGSSFDAKQLLPTGIIANPSPPKNFD